MTREESETNERYNRDVIGTCDHEPVKSQGGVHCRKCWCRFAVVLRPVMANPVAYDFEDDE
jgi:hypothetical protein